MVRSDQRKETKGTEVFGKSRFEADIDLVMNYCKMVEDKLESMKTTEGGAGDDVDEIQEAEEQSTTPREIEKSAIFSKHGPQVKVSHTNKRFKDTGEKVPRSANDQEQSHKGQCYVNGMEKPLEHGPNPETACKDQIHNRKDEKRTFRSPELGRPKKKQYSKGNEENHPEQLKSGENQTKNGEKNLERAYKHTVEEQNGGKNRPVTRRKGKKLVSEKRRNSVLCGIKRKNSRENYSELRKKFDALGFPVLKSCDGSRSSTRNDVRSRSMNLPNNRAKRSKVKSQDDISEYKSEGQGDLDAIILSRGSKRNEELSSVTSEITSLKKNEPQYREPDARNSSLHENPASNHPEQKCDAFTQKRGSRNYTVHEAPVDRSTEISSATKENTNARHAVKSSKYTVSVVAKKSGHVLTSNPKYFRKNAAVNTQQLSRTQRTNKCQNKNDLVEIYRNPKFKESSSEIAGARRNKKYVLPSQLHCKARRCSHVKKENIYNVRNTLRLPCTERVDKQSPQDCRVDAGYLAKQKMRSEANLIVPRNKVVRPLGGTRTTIHSIFSTVDFSTIPFVAGMSTSPTHNIKLNMQQVLSIIKTTPLLHLDCIHTRSGSYDGTGERRRRSEPRAPLSHWGSSRRCCSGDDASSRAASRHWSGTTLGETATRPEDVWVVDQEAAAAAGDAQSYVSSCHAQAGLVDYHEVLSRYVTPAAPRDKLRSARRLLELLRAECGRLRDRHELLQRTGAGGAELRALAADVRRKEAEVDTAAVQYREAAALRDRHAMSPPSAEEQVSSQPRTQLLRSIQNFQFRLRHTT